MALAGRNALAKIRIAAQNTTRPQFKEVADDLSRTEDRLERGGRSAGIFGRMMGNLGDVAKITSGIIVAEIGVRAVSAVKDLAGSVVKLALEGGTIQTVKNTFSALAKSIGETAGAMTTRLRTATQGMVSDFDLMKSANQFMSMGLADTGEGVAKLQNMAVSLGQAMGVGPTKAMEDFSLLLANQSIPRLDTFGISSGKVRERIKELQTQFKGMSRENAFMTAIMEQGQASMKRLGNVTSGVARGQAQFKATVENLKTSIATGLQPATEAIFDSLNNLLGQVITPERIASISRFGTAFGEKVAGGMERVGKVTAGLAPRVSALATTFIFALTKIKAVGDLVFGAISSVLDNLLRLLRVMRRQTTEAVQPLVRAFAGFSDILGRAVDALRGLRTNVKISADDMRDWAKGVGTAAEKPGLLTRAIDFLLPKLSDLSAKLKEKFELFVEAHTEQLDAAKTKLDEFVTDLEGLSLKDIKLKVSLILFGEGEGGTLGGLLKNIDKQAALFTFSALFIFRKAFARIASFIAFELSFGLIGARSGLRPDTLGARLFRFLLSVIMIPIKLLKRVPIAGWIAGVIESAIGSSVELIGAIGAPLGAAIAALMVISPESLSNVFDSVGRGVDKILEFLGIKWGEVSGDALATKIGNFLLGAWTKGTSNLRGNLTLISQKLGEIFGYTDLTEAVGALFSGIAKAIKKIAREGHIPSIEAMGEMAGRLAGSLVAGIINFLKDDPKGKAKSLFNALLLTLDALATLIASFAVGVGRGFVEGIKKGLGIGKKSAGGGGGGAGGSGFETTVPGAQHGGTFVARRPTLLAVGEAGSELINVRPLPAPPPFTMPTGRGQAQVNINIDTFIGTQRFKDELVGDIRRALQTQRRYAPAR